MKRMLLLVLLLVLAGCGDPNYKDPADYSKHYGPELPPVMNNMSTATK